VFTFFSSLGKTIQSIITNPSSVANLLATSLPQVSKLGIGSAAALLETLSHVVVSSLVGGTVLCQLCHIERNYAVSTSNDF
jgi:hypothetical protein